MVRILDGISDQARRPLAVLMISAMTCLLLGVVAGMVGTWAYSEKFTSLAGLTLQHLRPLHTTFGVAWIYMAGCAVVYAYLIEQKEAHTEPFWLRLKAHVILWAIAGVGVLVSLWQGVFSGREYMGAHWSWSVLIYVGWILFTWNFFSVVGFRLQGKPVFLYMWSSSLLLFLYSFAEGNAWHLAFIGDYPLRDIAMQWKSYGPMVGSFNLLVYGSLAFLSCKLAGNDRYAHSRLAFFLFFIGVFNSFTNFGHHTYHLPQSHLVKWISCIASLCEAVIVVKLLLDIVKNTREKASDIPAVHFLLKAGTLWSFLTVGSAVIISVPPINTLIHGTHFVMSHAMGSMIGINSVVLWAALLYLLHCMVDNDSLSPRRDVFVFATLNLAALLLVGMLATRGIIDGYLRYMGPRAPAPPDLLRYMPEAFMVLGGVLAVCILFVCLNWIRLLLPMARRAPPSAK